MGAQQGGDGDHGIIWGLGVEGEEGLAIGLAIAEVAKERGGVVLGLAVCGEKAFVGLLGMENRKEGR